MLNLFGNPSLSSRFCACFQASIICLIASLLIFNVAVCHFPCPLKQSRCSSEITLSSISSSQNSSGLKKIVIGMFRGEQPVNVNSNFPLFIYTSRYSYPKLLFSPNLILSIILAAGMFLKSMNIVHLCLFLWPFRPLAFTISCLFPKMNYRLTRSSTSAVILFSILSFYSCCLYSCGTACLMSACNFLLTLNWKSAGVTAVQQAHSLLFLNHSVRHYTQNECLQGRVQGSTIVLQQIMHSVSQIRSQIADSGSLGGSAYLTSSSSSVKSSKSARNSFSSTSNSVQGNYSV